MICPWGSGLGPNKAAFFFHLLVGFVHYVHGHHDMGRPQDGMTKTGKAVGSANMVC